MTIRYWPILALVFCVACSKNTEIATIEAYEKSHASEKTTCSLLIESNELVLKSNSENNQDFSISIGPGGTISKWTNLTTAVNYLADSYAGETTDRVVQWVLFNEEKNPDFPYGNFADRFNINQAGTEDDILSSILDVGFDETNCSLKISSLQNQQWKPLNRSYFSGEFYTDVTYRVFPDGSLKVQWAIEKRSAVIQDENREIGPEYYLETWIPLRQSAFETIDVGGRSLFHVEQSVPYYPNIVGSSLSGNVRARLKNSTEGFQLVFPATRDVFRISSSTSPRHLATNVLNFLDQSGVLGLLPATLFVKQEDSWQNSDWAFFERIFKHYVTDASSEQAALYWQFKLRPSVLYDNTLANRGGRNIENTGDTSVAQQAQKSLTKLKSQSISGKTSFH